MEQYKACGYVHLSDAKIYGEICGNGGNLHIYEEMARQPGSDFCVILLTTTGHEKSDLRGKF